MVRRVLRPVLLSAALASAWATAPAHAAPVNVDFDLPAANQSLVNANYLEGSFRFSPNCHYDRLPGGFGGSRWFGFDGSGCRGGLTNPDYTGPASSDPAVYVDYVGGVFSLTSLWIVQGGWTLTSSNGGSLHTAFADTDVTHNFAGPQWTDVSWLLFTLTDVGVPWGFDHAVMDVPAAVPEPTNVALFGAACFAVFFFARRKRTHALSH